MKKVVVAFLVLAAVFSFYIAYSQTDKEELAGMERAEEGIAKQQIVIPSDLLLANPEALYPILCKAANGHKVNLLRTSIHYRPDDRVEIAKYVLLTGDTHFFDAFRLESGRLLTASDTQQGGSFMSTANTGEPSQVGVIKDFGGNDLVTIRPLQAAYEQLPVYGQYYVEAASDEAYEAFIDDFVAKVNEHTRSSYTRQDFRKSAADHGLIAMASWFSVLRFLNYMISVVILVLLTYYIFSESRRIGIIKMHGGANIRLWFIVAGKMITAVFVVATVASLLAALVVKNTTGHFVGRVVLDQVTTYIVMLAISLVSYVYISRIKISDAIKNRQDTKGIFILNMLLKASCSIFVILLGLAIWRQYGMIGEKQRVLQNWAHVKDYGVFYPISIEYGPEDMEAGRRIVDQALYELYPALNRLGSVLIAANSYEERALVLNRNWNGIRSIKVNPNYLRAFPVYDADHNPVQVSEDTADWVLLVPEKYRYREKEILGYFQKYRADWKGVDEGYYKRTIPDSLRDQRIVIVWLANDQRVFSFNPDVFPAENNIIVDPIIEVMTESNSLIADRIVARGGGATDALKIRLIDRDAALTHKALKPDLERLGLDDNLKHLVTVHQFVLQEIHGLQEMLNLLWLVSLGLIAGLLTLVVQNLTIFFNRYQRRFIVRRLFGTDFYRTYKEYIWLFLVIWAFQLLISSALDSLMPSSAGAYPQLFVNEGMAGIRFLAVTVTLMAVELAASVVALARIEQKNKVKVLKGGI
ncbi:MAG TPA: DUF1430 domain-containing protein [Anaerolineae bacterium]|nr:DUF1430 domain-containing protein [Anaerolineae bacterium]